MAEEHFPKPSDIRGQEMEECREQLQQEKERLIGLFHERYNLLNDKKIIDYCFFLLDRRFDVPGIRSYFVKKISVYLLFETQQNIDKQQRLIRQLCFIAELIIVIQYLHNQILDQKNDVVTPWSINRNMLSSNMLRELLFEYMRKYLPSEYYQSIADTVAKVLMYVDIGQLIEINYGHYDAYKNDRVAKLNPNSNINRFIDQHMQPIKPIIEKHLAGKLGNKTDFAANYFRRIFLTNASLFVCFAELSCELFAQKNESLSNVVKQFAATYGMIIQIVNDVADMVDIEVETVGKSKEDVFSDLRNSNITLPLQLHLLQSPKRWIYRYLNNPERYDYIIRDFKTELHLELKATEAIEITVQLGKRLLVFGRSLLDTLNPQTPLLNDMLKIADWNKYYRAWYRKEKKM